ncbi:NmrA-like family protein, partial [Pseudoneurospora amorphoporcata]
PRDARWPPAAIPTSAGPSVGPSAGPAARPAAREYPHIYHFDGKAEVEEYTRSVGVPSTFFLAGFYISNLPGQTFRFNNGKKFIKATILYRDETLGKRLLSTTEYMTGDQLVEGFKKVFPEAGKTASYYQLPEDVYFNILKGLGMPEFVAQELLENMLLLGTFGYFGGESLD